MILSVHVGPEVIGKFSFAGQLATCNSYKDLVNDPSLQLKDVLSSPRKMAQVPINIVFSLSAQFSNIWQEIRRINYWFPHSPNSFYLN